MDISPCTTYGIPEDISTSNSPVIFLLMLKSLWVSCEIHTVLFAMYPHNIHINFTENLWRIPETPPPKFSPISVWILFSLRARFSRGASLRQMSTLRKDSLRNSHDFSCWVLAQLDYILCDALQLHILPTAVTLLLFSSSSSPCWCCCVPSGLLWLTHLRCLTTSVQLNQLLLLY